MPRKGSKETNIQSLTMVLNGGLNYAQSRSNIADNELTRALNFIYDPYTDQLMTRPGTSCQTATPFASAITIGYYYEVSTTEAYHICACGKKLYYLSGAGLDAWTEVGTDLLTGTYVPSFLTFNNKLLIADGDSNGIKSWAGAITGTVSTGISGSPKASALSMIKNRVVANAIDELDSVYLSKTNDETDWNTSGSAVGLKAGYGDSLFVNAFGVYGDDLVISKKGDKEKRFYRLNVSDATTTNWYVQDLSQNNAAQNAHTMINAWNNVFFVDNNGFKSLKGIIEYGDLRVDSVGRKINTIFSSNTPCDHLTYLPAYNAIWFNYGERNFCYTERYDPSSGNIIPAFTDIYFQWGEATSVYQAGDNVYLTGNNGYLYKLDESLSTDETSPSVTTSYTSAVRTKTLTFFTDGLLKKIEWYLNPKSVGTGTIYVCQAENEKTVFKTITTTAEGTYLYDMTGYLYDATDILYDTGTSPWVETSRSRIRSFEMSFEIEMGSGRVGVEWCKAEIAMLEGGE